VTYADTVPGPDGRPLDQIRLTGVRAVGHHGVLPHERAEGQTFSADVVLHLDTRAAATSDDLGDTVSYAEVAGDVHAVLSGEPVDLVETLAERIAAVVLDHASVHAVDVRVHKPQAPIEVPFDDVEIVVRRDRENAPAVASPVVSSGAAVPQDDPEPRPADASAADDVHEPVPVPVPVAASSPERAESPVHDAEPPAPVDPLDAAPPVAVGAVLALGSNLGDPQGTLRAAVTDIDRIPGVQVMEVSPLARTVAVGPDQPDFLNAVLLVRTTLPPRDLLGACQEIELLHGRVREERWGPRTLDVDLIVYGDLTASAEDLQLPHPRARERAFVLVPWAELDPEAVLGGLGGGPVAQLAATAPDRSGIRWLALDWLTEPASTGAVQVQPVEGDRAPVEPVPSEPVPVAPEHHEPTAFASEHHEPTPTPAPETPSRPHDSTGTYPDAPQAVYQPAAEPEPFQPAVEPESYRPESFRTPSTAWAPEPLGHSDVPPTPAAGHPGIMAPDLVTSVPGLPPGPAEVPADAPTPTPEPAPAPQQWSVPAPEPWAAPQEFYEPESRAFEPAQPVHHQPGPAGYEPERVGPPAYVPPPVSGPQQVAPTGQAPAVPPAPAAPPAVPPAPATDPGYPPYHPDHRPPGHV
jgi:dihydroneopterin aldolase/2-amino-4-hydroxy-6-hydroxymethyldihydropteridine diphosphokinase